ncbi:unnamed protein product [Brassica oleracea var. botrytis]
MFQTLENLFGSDLDGLEVVCRLRRMLLWVRKIGFSENA